MKSIFLALLGAAMIPAMPASASVFADDLSRCVVEKASPADRTTLVKWMFAALSTHPDVAAMANVSPAQRDSLIHAAGDLMTRLLTVDCRQQAVAAIKADGPGVVSTSFELLGGVAMRDFMGNAAVAASLEKLGDGTNTERLRDLFREAGLKLPAG